MLTKFLNVCFECFITYLLNLLKQTFESVVDTLSLTDIYLNVGLFQFQLLFDLFFQESMNYIHLNWRLFQN